MSAGDGGLRLFDELVTMLRSQDTGLRRWAIAVFWTVVQRYPSSSRSGSNSGGGGNGGASAATSQRCKCPPGTHYVMPEWVRLGTAEFPQRADRADEAFLHPSGMETLLTHNRARRMMLHQRLVRALFCLYM